VGDALPAFIIIFPKKKSSLYPVIWSPPADEDIRAIAVGGDLVRVLDRLYPGLSDIESLLQEPERGLPKLELQIQRRMREQ